MIFGAKIQIMLACQYLIMDLTHFLHSLLPDHEMENDNAMRWWDMDNLVSTVFTVVKRCTCPLEWQQSIIPSWTSWTLVNHLQCRHLWKLIAYGFLCFSSFWNESFKINNFWHLKKKRNNEIALKIRGENCDKSIWKMSKTSRNYSTGNWRIIRRSAATI